MARFLLNPVFSIETGELLAHDGESHEEPVILFDRSVSSQAGANSKTANGVAGAAGQGAAQIGSSLIPGLETDANHPTGFTPTEKSNMLVSGGETIGGANSGITGQANLMAARTRNAGGFANALDEAARIKGRQLATNAQHVNIADAALAHQKQQEARQQLQGIYGIDTGNQLKAMGISNQDLQTELDAKKQGWEQELEGGIGTLAKAASAYKPGGY